MSEKLFRVRWEIDLEAPTPADAARQALAILRDPDSPATFFDVRRIRLDGTKGKWHLIDALDQWVPTNAPDNDNDYACAELRAVANMIMGATPTDNVNPAVNPLTSVVDGVTYKTVPEEEVGSCKGCVARGDYPLCLGLDPNGWVCIHDNVIWAVSESKPETPPPPKRGTVRDPDNVSEFNQCVDPVVDGVLYRAVDALPGDECEGCAGGAYGTSLCSELPCCGSGGRDDGRSVVLVREDTLVQASKPEPAPALEPPTTGRPRSEDDFFVVDGVVYERAPELSPLSCEGCVADAQYHLCQALSEACLARASVWKLAGENAALYDGKLYKAVEQEGCKGCAVERGSCLPYHCGSSVRADGRSIIWIEVKK